MVTDWFNRYRRMSLEIRGGKVTCILVGKDL